LAGGKQLEATVSYRQHRAQRRIDAPLGLAGAQGRALHRQPYHSGSACKAFRPSSHYGAPEGISLGTAIAISGAAASPNMGYHSSPLVTLLLALFNVRLGWWLGNPGKEGDTTFASEGPANAIRPLFDEILAGRPIVIRTYTSQMAPFRKPRALRDGAAALSLHRRQRCRLRPQIRV